MDNVKFIIFFLAGMIILIRIMIWHETVRQEEKEEATRKLESAKIREEVLRKRAQREREKAERAKRKEKLWADNKTPLQTK